MPTPQNLPALIKEMQERARERFTTRFADDNGTVQNSKGKYETIIYDMVGDQVTDCVIMQLFIETLIADTANATLEYVKGVASELTLNNGSEGDDALKDLIARLTNNPE